MISREMHKKLLITLNIMLAVIILSACSSSKTKQVNWDIGNNVGEKWKDGQSYLMREMMAENENGYYYTLNHNSGKYKNLYYFDKVSGKSAVVCDQPNCKHDSDTCPAYSLQHFTNLCCYNGYLYYTESDKNQTIHLFQMDYDAHNKKEISTLCNINEGQSIDVLQFHRDNLFYYVVGRDGTSKLYRIDMINNEKTLLYDKKDNGTLMSVKFIDNYAYYEFMIIAADKTKTSIIYQYDIKSGESKKIIDGEYCNSYTVTKDFIYYATNYNVNKFDIASGTSSILLDDVKWAQLSNDGNHLYVDINRNSKGEDIPRKIIVYNWDNTIFDNIEVDNSLLKSVCLFGGKDYLFLYSSQEEKIYYFDKAKLGTNDHEWIESIVIK